MDKTWIKRHIELTEQSYIPKEKGSMCNTNTRIWTRHNVRYIREKNGHCIITSEKKTINTDMFYTIQLQIYLNSDFIFVSEYTKSLTIKEYERLSNNV